MVRSYETVSRPDGATLRVAWCRPDGDSPVATVVLLHGRSEFIEKYDEALERLTARGLEVFTFDWRGQGLSSRPLANRHKGHLPPGPDPFATHYLADLEALLGERVEPGRRSRGPLLLMAHSMGAHLGLRFQAAQPARVDAAVYLAPMLGIALPMPTRLVRGGLALARRLGLAERFVAERERRAETMSFASCVLTSDEQRFERLREVYARHPRLALGGPTVGWLEAALRSNARLGRRQVARAIGEPVLIAVPERDRVVDSAATLGFARELPDAELVHVPGAEHEILIERDVCQRVFWQAFDRFLACRLGVELWTAT